MKPILISLITLLSFSSFGQNLTGTWEGVFGTGDLVPGRRSSFMHLELKQDGKKIEGIFYYASPSTKKMDMMYEVSGELGRKKPFPFRLIRGKILVDDIFFASSQFVQFENISYLKKDSVEILSGKWVSDRPTGNATAGGFKVQKIDIIHLLLDQQRLKK